MKVIAEYWADGPRSETPPGHWNALAHGISIRDHHTIDDDVKLYFALNSALFDASIVAWDAKRIYDCIRPASAIQHKYAGQMIEAWAGPNQDTQLIRGEDWQPYQDLTFVTPAFPEYVSGHSAFSAAAATVLTTFTGSSQFYDGKTVLYNEDFNLDGIPDMLGQHVVRVNGNRFEASPSKVSVLQWETFQEAADEAGMSRRYGGIHFQDGDLRGREMGREVGAQAYRLAERYTYLLTATRGECSWLDDASVNPGPKAVGQAREAELRAAAKVLGLRGLRFLNYLDGELEQADPMEAIASIAKYLRQVRPQVVITFGPDGVTGHPDHIAICRLTTLV